MKIFKYFTNFVIVLITMLSCTENDGYDNNVSKDAECITINVIEPEKGNTRADYYSYSTVFETGDEIGVYSFDGSSYVSSNIRFVRQSDGSWRGDEDIEYNEDYTYYAYFPYRSTVYSPVTNSGDEDVKFAAFVTDNNNYFWKSNQSSKANFTSSNLLMSKGDNPNGNNITFKMKHYRGLAVLSGNNLDDIDYTLNGNIPYNLDGKKIFLLKPNVVTLIGGYSYTAAIGTVIERNNRESEQISVEDYLRFTALENGTFTLKNGSSTSYLTYVSYSLDEGATWTTTNMSNNTTITTPTVTAGNSVLWKGMGSGTGDQYNGKYAYFSSTGRYNVSGDLMSLIQCEGLDYSAKPKFAHLFAGSKIEDAHGLKISAPMIGDHGCYQMFSSSKIVTPPAKLPAVLETSCYEQMFWQCTSLTSAPELPATTATHYCYSKMFYGCTSLTTAPELPATKLIGRCYEYMFQGCSSLTTAPTTLPATIVPEYCYNGMFSGCKALTTAPALPATKIGKNSYQNMFGSCSALTTAPALPATTLAPYCYYNMFYGCASLTTAPTTLPATILTTGCYYNMFYGCTSLTTAPTLPATTLTNNCYMNMFQGCTSLTTAPALPATTLAQTCYKSMFQGCTALTTAPTLPATALRDSCYMNMFQGCTSLTTAPTLPATTLVAECYYAMFNGCKALNYIKAMFTDMSFYNAITSWVYNVASSGTFVKNSAATWSVTGNSGIPANWTVETASE